MGTLPTLCNTTLNTNQKPSQTTMHHTMNQKRRLSWVKGSVIENWKHMFFTFNKTEEGHLEMEYSEPSPNGVSKGIVVFTPGTKHEIKEVDLSGNILKVTTPDRVWELRLWSGASSQVYKEFFLKWKGNHPLYKYALSRFERDRAQ